MSRFFVSSENINNEKAIITGSDVAHLGKVLRKGVGDRVTLCDSKGYVYEAEIDEVTDEHISFCIINKVKSETEPIVPVILVQGVPKGEKAELIIQKTVELGVSEIRPALTEHTVVKLPTAADRAKKAARWQKISEEAAKQCGRGVVPEVTVPDELDNIIKDLSGPAYDGWLKLIPYENEQERTLKEALKNRGNAPGIVIIIGPEGGFSQKEVKKCCDNGFISVTLGKRILRTETAGLAAIAAIRYEIGD